MLTDTDGSFDGVCETLLGRVLLGEVDASKVGERLSDPDIVSDIVSVSDSDRDCDSTLVSDRVRLFVRLMSYEVEPDGVNDTVLYCVMDDEVVFETDRCCVCVCESESVAETVIDAVSERVVELDCEIVPVVVRL